MKTSFCLVLLILIFKFSFSQQSDTTILVDHHYVTLSNVVVDNRLNIRSFINRIKSDTSFYKAFKNLRILGYTAINDIRMLNAEGKYKATLHSKIHQFRTGKCRKMTTIDEESSGDIYNENHSLNYYTALMYASLFFTKDSVCNENNIVGDESFNTKNKYALEKHKEQLKMLFFNPGKKIEGLPFMSRKTAIYEENMADYYDMHIDFEFHNNTSCYVFKQTVKSGMEDNVVVDEMTTWFNDSTFEIVGRTYVLSYDAGVYDFKVNMEVQMTKYKNLIVPCLIKYNGNWKAIFKKRERGVFTATLYDFE
jgi:hypothetical protein